MLRRVGAPYIPTVLEAIGYDRDLARWAAPADSRVGRVLRVERGVATLMTERGELRATYGGGLLGWIAADSVASPCAGDWAVLRDWPDRRVTVERIVPRRTYIGSVGGQVLAANVDLVAVVVSAAHVDGGGVGPIVELARASGAVPVLVLTRCQQVPELSEVLAGCPAVATCVRTGRGLDELRQRIDRHLTMAFVGSPGEGKSDLVRALVGELAVRRAAKRQLHLLPGGGAVIDMPGLRAVA